MDEAARQLGRSIEQVRRYLREGKLPGRRIGQQWFIEEDALAAWSPRGRVNDTRVSAQTRARLGEAVATYEARTMKADETKKRAPLIDEDLLREIDETREKIRREYGEFDVVELLRRDREEH